MVQIVKRKKKGRPSKADLERRSSVSGSPAPPKPESRLRRSGRRRNVRYTFDFDDYIDEELDYEDEEDENERREKKLKLLMKLQQIEAEASPLRAPTGSGSSSDYGDKSSKKRKINGGDEIEDADGGKLATNESVYDDEKVRGQKVEPKGVAASIRGTPVDHSHGILLPDKKTLNLILDKLQKKDIYGVYAEPVDPEELPDYHEVIKNPMDFATVRKNLGNGKYLTLEQFESDVFLICSNAMQYNDSDTIYYKQAFSIQELARRKFQRFRMEVDRPEKELKIEENTTSNAFARMQIKKTIGHTLQEPVGSDFSSGATLAMAGDVRNGSSSAQAGGCERPNSVDRRLMEGYSSLVDNILDKGEESLPGKGLLSRPGRKASVHDENRRATYNISDPFVSESELMLTTSEGESQHLVPVGLHTEHAYARSLARFAATLGSVAWKVASRRIEQALPAGSKFGRGWVGEYEPLPTPVLMLEKCNLKEPTIATRLQCNADLKKGGKKAFKTPISGKEHPVTVSTEEKQLPSSGIVEGRSTITSNTNIRLSAKEEPVKVTSSGAKLSFFPSPRTKPTDHTVTYKQQNSQSRTSVEPEPKESKQVELNRPPLANQRVDRQILKASEMPASRSVEMVPLNKNILQSVSSKPNVNGVVAGNLHNGQVVSSGYESRISKSHSDNLSNQRGGTATFFPHGQDQGLSDPVQLMRMLTEKAQHQHNTSLHYSPTPVPHSQSQSPSIRKNDSSNNAAAAAARAWMSVGAGGFKPVAESTITHTNQPQVSRFRGEFPFTGIHQIQQPDKNSFPLHAFVQPPVRMGNEAYFQNQPMVFSQLLTTPDLSRFHVQQSPWRAAGLNPQTQARQKQESLPPDLNIGYQSSGSPGRQSSGIMVDSQQPDLALQL